MGVKMKGLISMKIRKLTGILVAAAMIASYGTVLNVTAGADTTVGWSYSQEGEIDGVAVTYVGVDELFPNGLNSYIHDYFFTPGNGTSLSRTIPVQQQNDGTFPVCLTSDNLRTLRAYHNGGYTVELTFQISDPASNVVYTATINSANTITSKLPNSQLNLIDNAGALNLALSFSTGNEVLTIKGYNILMSDSVTFPVTYKVPNTYFTPLLTQSGLYNGGLINNEEILALYAIGGDEELLAKEINPENTLIFTMTEKCRKGVFLKNIPDEDYYTKKEAENEVIRPYLYKYLGFNEDGLISSIDSKFTNAKEYIEDEAIPGIKKMIPDLSTYEEIIEAIDDYCYENKPEFIEAFASDIDITDKVEEVIKDVLGDEEEDDEEIKEALYDYVYDKVMKEVTEQLEDYNVTIDKKIAKTVEEALENELEDAKSDIIAKLTSDPDFIAKVTGKDGDDGKSAYEIAVENGYKGTLSQWLESLQGDKGDEGDAGLSAYEIAVKNGFKGTISEWLQSLYGEDGAAGEGFEAWAKRNYGSVENFMDQISFEGWAEKNYGSVNNFIKSVTNESGLSAYELAVENGYKGSLTQWLNSLKGEDGKSAYEIAVEQGFRGDEDDWLDSLKGEDGKDGEDGEDGEDGQVIYVNGTYGQVPNSGTTTDDVVLVPDNVYYGKPGNVNPATGVAAGIVLPAAAVGSVLLVKKGKRRRGRK